MEGNFCAYHNEESALKRRECNAHVCVSVTVIIEAVLSFFAITSKHHHHFEWKKRINEMSNEHITEAILNDS